MKQIRVPAMLVAMLFAGGTFAQSGQGHEPRNQGSAQGAGQSQGRGGEHGLPPVDEQVQVLTGTLDLTADQQAKVKPIMQELHDATVKLMQDKKLSNKERLDKVRPLRYNAGQKLREILNDDQKKKLDQYLQGPHHEMHGDLEGRTQPSQQPPKR